LEVKPGQDIEPGHLHGRQRRKPPSYPLQLATPMIEALFIFFVQCRCGQYIFLGKCLYGQMSFWANVLLGKCLLGKCLSGQMSFWANVLLGKRLMGKRLLGKCLSGQTSFWANISWANVFLVLGSSGNNLPIRR
jgi:hypothetical protein